MQPKMHEDDDTIVLAIHSWVSGTTLKIKVDYMSLCVQVFVVASKTQYCEAYI